jgi:hypothetical protein
MNKREQIAQLNLHLGLRLIVKGSDGIKALKEVQRIGNAYLSQMGKQIADNAPMVLLLENRVRAMEPLVNAMIDAPDTDRLLLIQEYLEGLAEGKVSICEDGDTDDATMVYTSKQIGRLLDELRHSLLPYFATPAPLDNAINEITNKLS